MKIGPAKANAFIAKPDGNVRAFLLYGPDRGQVRERLGILTKQIVEDENDPFRVVTLTGADLSDDPARLTDEAAAISFGGGQRVVRVLDAPDSAAGPLKDFLDNPVGDARVIVTADNLAPRAALRKLAEAHERAAAIACYTDSGRDLQTVIAESLAGFGVRADRSAALYLERALGGDRLATRSELEKLALYVQAQGKEEASVEDAAEAVGDSADLSMDDLVYAVGGGDVRTTDRLTRRLLAEGIAPVGILRGVARHFDRLHFLAGKIRAGESAQKAVDGLRPPVFFKFKAPLATQAGRWREPALQQAIAQLIEAERLCKRTGYPDEAVCARALLSLSARAERLFR